MSEMEKARILVVDDDKLTCELLLDFLQLKGYGADCANDGMEAVKKIENGDYSVVISDVRMPQMNGMELLAKIKSFNPHIEIIMITAHSAMEIALKCMEKGAFGFIQKPIEDLNEILATVQKAVDIYLFKKKMILRALSK